MRNSSNNVQFIAFRDNKFFAFKITVDIDRTVLVGDKNLKSRRKLVKRFSHASVLDRFYEFFIADFTILIHLSEKDYVSLA